MNNQRARLFRLPLLPETIDLYGYLCFQLHLVLGFLLSFTNLFITCQLKTNKNKLFHFTLIRLTNIFLLGTNRFI